jgi:hypothetical protein
MLLDSEAAMSRSGIFKSEGRVALWMGLFLALSKLVFPTRRKWLTHDRFRGSILLGDSV